MEEQNIKAEEFLSGRVLLIDKPLEWTSFDVVKKIRALLRHRLKLKKIKVGHAGTLDPLATGLLIICTGKKTREIENYQNKEKEYTGTFFLGASTPSSDLETAPDEFFPTNHITKTLVIEATQRFTGEIDQIPPLFSAKKIDGERAYFHARRGDATVLKSNKIFIREFEITQLDLPEAEFRVVCSKGTYIRSLARDFGKEVNSGAYLKKLRRTKIGEFSVEEAWSIDQLENYFKKAEA
ncbi:MAG: tRNA pseudouridine(55) synthase TruB [Bacteroidales bacterium]